MAQGRWEDDTSRRQFTNRKQMKLLLRQVLPDIGKYNFVVFINEQDVSCLEVSSELR